MVLDITCKGEDMRVMISESIGIKSDSHNFIVFELVERTNNKTQEKYLDDKDLGYHGNLKSALDSAINNCMRLSQQINDIDMLVVELKKIRNTINNISV
jgi:CRISPR/Cas system endoribonuclease Cas6 (RAMP superfamily)